ncbi:MAG: hypothetical protein EOS23_16875 [Mesorhizobium sp.]|uniref:hypothetical protein n=1 Tax=unclassified Mesorhizobium TaxID=325217 RepID=UPI000FCAC571|nr:MULTISPECIES: hypothetical protein [unclassified Mesorhizobium]RUV63056.1 hypothetical protein EOA85_04295 [Mesorhizobium sp. M5C.F.Ca.IN.020.29.1.1]RWC32102.1 MAG: hypothetical protein EOS70_18555 [Mesorhizobium sp.]RWE10034.1 MAG: hypothetical protein EOS23_16875 [Mesorhizobium sp.]RWE54619.1 MAG: hypothetical protein EOS67_22925 [Mesorhizobium sp.]TIS68278.1 MAG: hypothetical protein E5W92_08055 [Mesorhizobium sp.]
MSAHRDKAEAFAASLMTQAVWPLLLVLAALVAAPFIAVAAQPQTTTLASAAWLVAAASGMVTLAVSALLVFDALLFWLMASHISEAAGGASVDDVLARMRVKPAAAGIRSLDRRIAGTQRLLMKQRIALGLFVAASAVALSF